MVKHTQLQWRRPIIGAPEPAPKRAFEGYRWMDKDPIIDEMMALAKQDGRSLSAIARAAYISPTTAHNWDKGATKKPNNASVRFFLRAMGYRQVIVKAEEDEPVYRWRSNPPQKQIKRR